MEINKEALEALSLADLIALSQYSNDSKHAYYKIYNGRAAEIWEKISLEANIEIKKRINNIFIF